MRCPERKGQLIIDPFHAGALLSEHKCRLLLQKHVGNEVAFSKSLLAPATRQQIVVRMLLNLKRIYVNMRSFPQARDVTELLLAITPSALSELRDRGLLAYHLNDVTAALRDLQTYLKLLYVHMRSFPQARAVTEMLLALTPSALSELRDRGLLAYHLNDVTGALRDLQTYLKLSSAREMDKDARDEHEQIWEHVKTLRRRVASLN